MRVQFQIEGGIAYFPGLSQPIVINSDELAPAEANELKQKVEAARFFNLPNTVGAPAPGAADYRYYTITVEAGEQYHTVRIIEPIEDPNLQTLVDYLRTKVRSPRRGTSN